MKPGKAGAQVRDLVVHTQRIQQRGGGSDKQEGSGGAEAGICKTGPERVASRKYLA